MSFRSKADRVIGQLELKILGSEIKDDSSTRKGYVVYRVQIRCEGGTWVVNRRYNQFKMLNDCLSKSITLPAVLPPRKLTGNLEAEFIAQRSAALEAYLQAIVRDTVVINAKEFRAFIDSNLDASSSTLRATLAGGGRAGSGRDSRDYGNAVSRKVCVLGYMGVGKSSLTIQYAEGQFIDAYSPTIENTFQKLVKHRDTEYLIEILDTAGQDEYQIFHMRYAMGIHGYILMYAVNIRRSFEMLKTIHEKLVNAIGSNHVPRVLVGSKSDLTTERQVSPDEGCALAQLWGCPFLECSAKFNENIMQTFTQLLMEIEKQTAPAKQDESCSLM